MMTPKSTSLFMHKNLLAWELKTELHFSSQLYDVKGFIDGKNTLHPVELVLLGDVANKDVIHLQCHFGLDTLSLARLGANACGIDFSHKSIEYARQLADKTGLYANFIESNIYDIPVHTTRLYDIVFTSYGAICWLPDINNWAHIVSSLLKPGGTLVLVDFHPMYQYFDFNLSLKKKSYFNINTIKRKWEGTYTNYHADIHTVEYNWNHSLGEVFQAVKNAGLNIEDFNEYSYLPVNWFPNLILCEDGLYRIKKHENMYPLLFSLKARKQ